MQESGHPVARYFTENMNEQVTGQKWCIKHFGLLGQLYAPTTSENFMKADKVYRFVINAKCNLQN